MKSAIVFAGSIAVFIIQSAAQSIHTNPSAMVFDTTLAGTNDSLSLWIVNNAPAQMKVTDINIFGGSFSVKDTAMTINANDSAKTFIFFSSIHNLTYYDFAFIETNLTSGTIVVPLSGTKKYSEPLYKSTQGLSGEPLKTALNTITMTGHTTLGYNTARDWMYGTIDNVGGDVECVYTGRKATFNTRSGATSNNFNCEHTWPQSKFSEADPMRSDINHLFSTDETANSKRSNYPFGVVVSSTWNVGGSKFGSGLGGQTVFEPRDEHKGDCARAMFYFITRYPNNYGSFWAESPYQEMAFRDWNKRFPPTAKSIARNNGVQQYQGNRNPFIDHPEFVERINNFGGTANIPSAGIIVASPRTVEFGTIDFVGSSDRKLVLANNGNKSVAISSISISHPAFSLTDTITYLASNSYRIVNIHFSPLTGNPDSSETMTINYSDGTAKQIVVNLAGFIVTSALLQEQVPSTFALHQNYPNPFNPVTKINYQLPMNGHVTLKVYDMLGREVTVLVNDEMGIGEHAVSFDASALPSGMYLYRLTTGNSSIARKMVLQK